MQHPCVLRAAPDTLAAITLCGCRRACACACVCAAPQVRDMLKEFAVKRGLGSRGVVRAEDFMDDGSRIQLAITIDGDTGSATFDFTGTDPEVRRRVPFPRGCGVAGRGRVRWQEEAHGSHRMVWEYGAQVYGNHNAPPAVTYSAVIYSLRCLVGTDIPLNQGCLAPVDIIIPKVCAPCGNGTAAPERHNLTPALCRVCAQGCLLNPSPEAGVVGGNVLTSQRVVDVVLKAFAACAASYGETLCPTPHVTPRAHTNALGSASPA